MIGLIGSLDRVLTSLEKECEVDGKARQFAVSQPWLADGIDGTQADAAIELCISESAIRVTIHRLRKRFRPCVGSELDQTLAPGISVDDEMQYMLNVLSGAAWT